MNFNGYPTALSIPGESTSALVGGKGGKSFLSNCPEGSIGIGLKGEAAKNVHSAELVCSDLSSEKPQTSACFGDGCEDFNEYLTLCPDTTFANDVVGHGVIIGMDVKYGDYSGDKETTVLQIILRCGYLSKNSNGIWGVDPDETNTIKIGDGKPDFIKEFAVANGHLGSVWIPDNSVITGIVGRDGLRLDAIGFTYMQFEKNWSTTLN
ncbi:MAG: hypothetical protein HQ542_07075 [Bacteroidia bacterium]|nr:hypothetical protein [Bacteroidia bacterium]